MTIIKPSVGRALHFFPSALYMDGRKLAFSDPSQPLAAMISYVHSDTMVNLTAWDQNGVPFSVCSVPLVQGGAGSVGSFYAEWMPYQKGQAAKTEQLAEQLKGASATITVPPLADTAIELEIQAKGLTAPRITPADLQVNITSAHYFIVSEAIQHPSAVHECGDDGWYLGATQLLTICVLQLRNGFTVTGESACASPENFDAEVGRKIARENAVAKVWPLMGYALRERLHQRELYEAEPKTGSDV